MKGGLIKNVRCSKELESQILQAIEEKGCTYTEFITEALETFCNTRTVIQSVIQPPVIQETVIQPNVMLYKQVSTVKEAKEITTKKDKKSKDAPSYGQFSKQAMTTNHGKQY